MSRQHTIAKPASLSGTGVHSGKPARLTVRPAPAGRGVSFVRSDMGGVVVPASALAVSTTVMGTNLTKDGVSVATVEHFMAACAGVGIDNIVAELDGPELPIVDGSSKPFVDLLLQAGVVEQESPRRILRIQKPVEVREGVKYARLSPGQGFEMRIAIDFASKVIGRQTINFAMKPGAFAKEIAWARTYGFKKDAEALYAQGKALGASLDNTIVIDGDTVLNEDGLQAPDEFVRHKLLDVIGDLSLAGGVIEGLYEAEQPGHALNNRLLRAVFADETAFAWTAA
jgi:UDP-3-O-[3-hydroxymyristoyl] N-acetylglucosamine deacetylase